MPIALSRRLVAGTALAALPAVALVGCGAQSVAKKESVQTSVQKASAALSRSGAISVALHLSDPKGTLRRASSSGTDGLTPGQADVLLGTTVSVTIDPITGTVGEAQKAAATQSPADQLRLVNLAVSVRSGGDSVAELRIVRGDAYVSAGLDRIDALVRSAGSTQGVTSGLDQLAASSPDLLAPLVADVKAGKWVELPLDRYADQLGAMTSPTPTTDPALGGDLLAALKPYTTVTDVAKDGDTRTLDVRVRAKQGLQAAFAVLQRIAPTLGRLRALPADQFDALGDGTLDGQVTLKGDHLERVTLDLASAARLAPGGTAQDLTGSTVTVDVDDTADEVQVPTDVSSVDLSSLVEQGIAAARSAGQ